MKINIFFVFFLFLSYINTLNLFCQEQIKILTPLGNQPNDKTYPVKTSNWDESKVESCRQAWLNEGGVFLRDNNEQEIKFLERNNFLSELRGKCLLVDGNNVWLGTEDGIYKSTDKAASWLTWDNDGMKNLDNKIIYDLAMRNNVLFACTNYGLFASDDGGENWGSLRTSSTTCVKFEGTNTIYAGGEAGLYKSTDGGSQWSLKLSQPINCLHLSSSLLFAGGGSSYNYRGLWKSTNGGDNWEQKYFNDFVTDIFIDGSNIYIGTEKQGILKSTNGGVQFTNYNNGLPKLNSSDYYRINSIQKYENILYAATDCELYFYDISGNTWRVCSVYDHIWAREYEYLTKKIYIDEQNNLWIVCSKRFSPKYPSATLVTDYDYPMNPENFNAFNCHTFAWHFTEGGITGIALDAPKRQKYIPQDNANEWERNNWDYIEADSWQDPDWEKVKYQGDHSGIRSPKMTTLPNKEDDLLIISKWSVNGPLVEHRLNDHPWKGGTAKYYKSKKVVKGQINNDRRIGRELTTLDSYDSITTVIPEGANVNFYVAPMKNAKIDFKPGFHAEKGSTLHAFVKDYYFEDNNKKDCKIPWEEEPTMLYSQKDSASEVETKGLFSLASSSGDSNFINNLKNKSIEKVNSSAVRASRIDTQPCYKFFDPFTFSGKGSGTKDDPYQISDIEHFKEYFNDREGDHYWILMNDLDGSVTRYWGFKGPDGISYMGFDGLSGFRQQRQLDGQGFKITNLYKLGTNFAGGFNCFTLKRIGFENLDIRNSQSANIKLMEQEENRAIDFVMEECYFTGTLTAPTTDVEDRGIYALGQFFYNTKIRNCYVDLHIITDSLIRPTVDIPDDTLNRDVVVENVYSKVTTNANKRIYSPFGYAGNIISCFWDNDIIKITEPLGKGIGLPTSEMKKREPFEKAGWDFENVWYIDEGMDYPRLRVFKKELSAEKVNQINEYSLTVTQNPQLSSYKVNYELPVAGSIELELYSAIGTKVQVLVSESNVQPGSHSINLEGSGLNSGLYFVVMKANRALLSQKIIIIN